MVQGPCPIGLQNYIVSPVSYIAHKGISQSSESSVVGNDGNCSHVIRLARRGTISGDAILTRLKLVSLLRWFFDLLSVLATLPKETGSHFRAGRAVRTGSSQY